MAQCKIRNVFFWVLGLAFLITYAGDRSTVSAANSYLSPGIVNGAEKSQLSVSNFLSPSEKDNCEVAGMLIPVGNKVPVSCNTQQLKSFFAALTAAKQKKMHIAHWGDSIILGDIISENLREDFQKQFGGNGAGWISINCDDFGMRNSIVVSFSEDWKESSIVKRNPGKLPLGISGAVYQPVQGSWVKYEIGKVSRTIRNLSLARLFYSNVPAGGTIQYYLNNSSTPQTARLDASVNLKELNITCPSGTTSIKYVFNNCQGGYFYGVSFENGEGVYLDNLPIRGNSGASLTDIPIARLKEFNSLMNYKLLIINFGVNVISPEHSNYLWYEGRMEKVISHLREAFPQASILLISVSDKAVKKGSRFMTDSGIPPLLRSQQTIAEKNNVAFWNSFQAMGGENSVVNWVESTPPLANKDYCHLKQEGGKILADLLFEALMKEMKK
ncbi:MAG: hypothetical protein LWX56_12795 [Ignavibacteria bacterium]|nr:hypothetical protein [Ignavibacteria bacterium]